MQKGPIKFSINRPMVSVMGEIDRATFKLVIDQEGRRWCYQIGEHGAEQIFAEKGNGMAGFGGSTLTFSLDGGTSVDIVAPWHTTADSLFKATGVDLRDHYRTQGIVALKRTLTGGWGNETFDDVLHYDEEPTVGAFDRVDRIAERFAEELQQPVYMSVVTSGGGHRRIIRPRSMLTAKELEQAERARAERTAQPKWIDAYPY